MIASASDDGKVFIWEVPEGFTLYTDAEEIPDVAPVSKLGGHSRYAGHALTASKHMQRLTMFETEKSDRSSSTLRPKTSSPRPRATTRSRSGTLAPARLRSNCSTATLCRACHGMRPAACSSPRRATRRFASGTCARTSPSTRHPATPAPRTAGPSGWASTTASPPLASPR